MRNARKSRSDRLCYGDAVLRFVRRAIPLIMQRTGMVGGKRNVIRSAIIDIHILRSKRGGQIGNEKRPPRIERHLFGYGVLF